MIACVEPHQCAMKRSERGLDVLKEFDAIEDDHKYQEFQQKALLRCADEGGENFLWSGGKDGAVLRWDLAAQSKTIFGPSVFASPGPSEPVLSLAALPQGKGGSFSDCVAVGRGGGGISILDARAGKAVCFLAGHRGAVTGLAFGQTEIAAGEDTIGDEEEEGEGAVSSPFNTGSGDFSRIYSSATDRSIRVQDLRLATCGPLSGDVEAHLLDVYFGHVGAVNALATHSSEGGDILVSAGADGTTRRWNVRLANHSVFGDADAAGAPVDAAAIIDLSRFVSGGQDGALRLWSAGAKKARAVAPEAHGGSWISAIAAVSSSDLILSGSSDGFLRLWRLDADSSAGAPDSQAEKKPRRASTVMKNIHSVPAPGHINAVVQVASRCFALAVGKDERFGRWNKIPSAKNGVLVVDFAKNC